MAQVFLSYDRADAAKARAIAQALERAGHLVWWDLHIKGGAEYGKAIEEALAAADAVVVLWSAQSVDSAWVRDEAAAGRDSSRLVPILIEPVNPPMGFRQYQNLDFSAWKGRGKPPRMADLLDSLETLGGKSPSTQPVAPRGSTAVAGHRLILWRTKWWWIVGAAVLLLGLLIARPWEGKASVPVVAVRTADATSSSAAMARDLLVKLGSLRTAHSGSMRLLSHDDGTDADLTFQAGAGAGEDQGMLRASLVLTTGKDGAVLWAKDFEQASGKLADLKQQMAYTAARVLGCALEGLNAEGKRLPAEALKLYLNACAQLSETASADPTGVIPAFRKVISAAPSFEAAWSKLLLAESESAEIAFTGGVPDQRARAALRRDIQAARRVNRNLAEATLAEMVLLPRSSFGKIIALADRAERDSPDNVSVLIVRSTHLQSVGRLREAVESARRAADLDPLSPSVRNAYISALTYTGRFDSARRELAKAEQLWPGTATVADAQYRFHLRYGDPKIALAMPQLDSQGGAPRLFLEARADPTPANVDKFFGLAEARLARMPDPAGAIGFMTQAYGEFGRIDKLVAMLLDWSSETDLALISDIYFRPQMQAFRRDPRFMQVARRSGLLDYWRSSDKWPDFCFEPDHPYDCKAEAAKLS